MTTSTERAAALKAAISDIARDIEAELGILSRFRGSESPSSNRLHFRDPGDTLTAYEAQKTAHPGAVSAAIAQHANELSRARELCLTVEPAERATLLTLIDQIREIRTIDDAAALVATLN